MRYLILSITFLFYLTVIAQNQALTPDDNKPRELQIDQTHLAVSLSFQPEKGQVNGSVELDFINTTDQLDSLWLDAVKMDVSLVKFNGQLANTKTYDRGVAVFFNEPLELNEPGKLTCTYVAKPKRGMYFIGWNDPSGESRKQIWTQGQGIDNRHWVPHVDTQNDKLLTSIQVDFQNGYEVVSNGKLIKKEVNEEYTTWHYKMSRPHSSYLMMLAIGKYGVLESKSESSIPLLNYYYTDWKERNAYTYYKSDEIFNFLEEEIGIDYPWMNYKQVPVKDFQHGAMENTTATIFGDFYCVDALSANDDGYVRVNAHELAHQWFGNLVTSYGAHDHWLHEGFATYYSWLAEGFVSPNTSEVERIKVVSQRNINNADLNDSYPLAHSKAGSSRFYDKGAWVLYMLRNRLGDELFQSGIELYLKTHKDGMVNTNDFRIAMEEASGLDLGFFFDQWVHRIGIPMIEASISLDEKSQNLTVNCEQKQVIDFGNRAYQLEIPFVVKTNLKTHRYILSTQSKAKEFSLILDPKEEVKYVIIDPNHRLLANWKWDLPRDYIINFLLSDSVGTQMVYLFDALGEVSKEDKKWLKKIELFRYNDITQEAFMLWLVGNLDNVDKVWFAQNLEKCSRRAKLAFLENVPKIDLTYKSIVESWLHDSTSYDVRAVSFLRLATQFPDDRKEYLKEIENYYGTRGNKLRVYYLLISFAEGDLDNLKEMSDAREELTEMTSEKYDFMTRMNAFEAFAALGFMLDEDLCINLFQGVFQGNRRLRKVSIQYLKECWKYETKQKVILAHIERESDNWEEWQIKRINNIFDLRNKE